MTSRGRVILAAGALALALAMAGCGDDPVDLPVDLDLFQGLYELTVLGFDPQGSPPPADVLDALEAAGEVPTLNVGRTGSFQLFYRDPVSGNIETYPGSAQGLTAALRLTFDHQAHADAFLLPRHLTLDFDDQQGTLSFDGAAEVSRSRLRQLFPDLYTGEQLHDPTPGTLTVRFQRRSP